MLEDERFRRTARCGHFTKLLAKYSFPPYKNDVESVSASRFGEQGFDKPIVVKGESKANDLGLVVPGPKTTLNDVANMIGRDFPVKLIEVGTQTQFEGHTIGQFADYLEGYTPGSHKVLNMITLECSATPLASHIQAPQVVREVDWIDSVWPLERRARGDFPQVQKYCLSGMAESFTDFHVDFGGTSVWYHVISGCKRFFLIPPSAVNLLAYTNWTKSSTQDDVFFGDVVEEVNKGCSNPQVFQLDLMPGQTLMIPSAWIHAVYTPVDSLVFGGNFLHSGAIIRQLQVCEIETRSRVGKQYCFPHFKTLNAYFLATLLPYVEKRASKMLASKPDAGVEEQNVNEDHDSDSDDDDEEELQAIAEALLSRVSFSQIPFLLRLTGMWLDGLSSGPASATGASVYATTASKAEAQELKKMLKDEYSDKYDSWKDLLGRWWAVCERMSAYFDEAEGGKLKTEESTADEQEKKGATATLITELRTAVGLNMLDYTTIYRSLLNIKDTWPETPPEDKTNHPGLRFTAPPGEAPLESSVWVQCYKCSKWRTLPPGTDVTTLPERWECTMNVADPERASCAAMEEKYISPDTPETTDSSSRKAKPKRKANNRSHLDNSMQSLQSTTTDKREWVCCDICGKWRALPHGADIAALPESWDCSMNKSDPAHATCDVPEEQSTEISTSTSSPLSAALTTTAGASSGLKLSLGALRRKAQEGVSIANKDVKAGAIDDAKGNMTKIVEVIKEENAEEEADISAADFADSDSSSDAGEGEPGENKGSVGMDTNSEKKLKRVRLKMPSPRKKAAPKPAGPDIYKVTYTQLESVDKATSSGARFGTRGKRLSADYLKASADVDVDEDGGDAASSPASAAAVTNNGEGENGARTAPVTFASSPEKERAGEGEWDEFEDGDDNMVTTADFQSSDEEFEDEDEEEEEDDDDGDYADDDDELLEEFAKEGSYGMGKKSRSKGGGKRKRDGPGGKTSRKRPKIVRSKAVTEPDAPAFAARKFDPTEDAAEQIASTASTSDGAPPLKSNNDEGLGQGRIMKSAAMLRAEAAARAHAPVSHASSSSFASAAAGTGMRKVLPNNRANLLKIAASRGRGMRR